MLACFVLKMVEQMWDRWWSYSYRPNS